MPYTLAIPSTETTTDPSGKPYTTYHLTVSTPLRTQVLPKRYSDFTALDAALRSTAGALPPPAPLPAKAWFKRTVHNPALTEERRNGLLAYLAAIEQSGDPRWRESSAYRTFLGFASAPGRGERGGSVVRSQEDGAEEPRQRQMLSSAAWLDLHHELRSQIQSARLAIARRDQAGTAAAQHESSALAKRALLKSHTLLLRLDEGLVALSAGDTAAERLGEGELRRRRDLLARARKEREGLEGVLNAFAPTRSQARSPSPPSSTLSGTVPGAFPSSSSSITAAVGGGRRVLGAPARETERTRELGNDGVLQLQQQLMREQDADVQDLAVVVRRMKEMGVAINEELVDQGQLLDVLDQDVDRVEGKIGVARKRVKKIR